MWVRAESEEFEARTNRGVSAGLDQKEILSVGVSMVHSSVASTAYNGICQLHPEAGEAPLDSSRFDPNTGGAFGPGWMGDDPGGVGGLTTPTR